jgi:hypothetical protein
MEFIHRISGLGSKVPFCDGGFCIHRESVDQNVHDVERSPKPVYNAGNRQQQPQQEMPKQGFAQRGVVLSVDSLSNKVCTTLRSSPNLMDSARINIHPIANTVCLLLGIFLFFSDM